MNSRLKKFIIVLIINLILLALIFLVKDSHILGITIVSLWTITLFRLILFFGDGL